MKIYFSEMTPKVIDLVRKRINKLFEDTDKISFTKHCEIRMKEKHISKKDIANVLKSYYIVECNTNSGDFRALIRSNIHSRNNAQTCLCVSLINNKIITCYKNELDDNHSTLRTDEYASPEEFGFEELLNKHSI